MPITDDGEAQMRWRKITLTVLIGALLGFGFQMTLDFFTWHWVPSPEWTVWSMLSALERERNHGYLEKELPLFEQGVFLWWLQLRGETIWRSTLIGSFLLVSIVMATEQRRRKSPALREVMLSPDGSISGEHKSHLM